jgi:hypothetical protein
MRSGFFVIPFSVGRAILKKKESLKFAAYLRVKLGLYRTYTNQLLSQAANFSVKPQYYFNRNPLDNFINIHNGMLKRESDIPYIHP